MPQAQALGGTWWRWALVISHQISIKFIHSIHSIQLVYSIRFHSIHSLFNSFQDLVYSIQKDILFIIWKDYLSIYLLRIYRDGM